MSKAQDSLYKIGNCFVAEENQILAYSKEYKEDYDFVNQTLMQAEDNIKVLKLTIANGLDLGELKKRLDVELTFGGDIKSLYWCYKYDKIMSFKDFELVIKVIQDFWKVIEKESQGIMTA